MRRVDKLIDQIRRQTENEDQGLNFGITDIEFLQYLNDAQHRLQSLITAQHEHAFVKEKIYSVSRGIQEYKLPEDTLLENKILSLEYSPTKDEDDYYHLRQRNLHNRETYDDAYPDAYIRRSGHFLLQPTPSQSGLVRLNYIKRVNNLDLRRAKVLVATQSGTTITSLILDITNSKTPIDIDTLNSEDYICLCDKDGTVKALNIPIENIDTATGVVTIEAGFELEESELLTGSLFVTADKFSSTHSELSATCERYLIAYAAWKILKRDSSADFAEQQAELTTMENDIVNSFANIDSDLHFIPIIDTDH